MTRFMVQFQEDGSTAESSPAMKQLKMQPPSGRMIEGEARVQRPALNTDAARVF